MIMPSSEVVRAILNLENNVSWKEIVAWIEKSYMTQSVANNNSSGEITIKNQGRNLELMDLLKHISKARTYEENIKFAKQKTGG